MSKKKPFVLRLDEQTLKDVEKWAADELRSTNGQIEWIVREALKKSGRMRKAELQKPNDDEPETN